jgi:hypothetical protein
MVAEGGSVVHRDFSNSVFTKRLESLSVNSLAKTNNR